ncbi:MAG: hypothetical protein ACOZAP_05025, partial [Pseudomonadota bacterium]
RKQARLMTAFALHKPHKHNAHIVRCGHCLKSGLDRLVLTQPDVRAFPFSAGGELSLPTGKTIS